VSDNKIIDLQKAKDERTPHLSGKARCLTCHYDFVAVMPVGCQTVTCSKCGHDAHMLGEVVTNGDQWRCTSCRWFLFRVDRHSIYCPKCGQYQRGF